MEENKKVKHPQKPGEKEKILLLMLPFWTPLIPPMGISCLKSFLQTYQYPVKTVDFNIRLDIKKIYDSYFTTLGDQVPENKRGNFYSIGHDVLQNHMTAHLNYEDETGYIDLVKLLIAKTYYCDSSHRQVKKLNRIVADFYAVLEKALNELLDKEKPTVLGISVNSGTIPASLFAFKLTKSKCPAIKTVMGGGIFCDQLAKGSANFERFLSMTESYIDNIFIGEGELLFLKWLQGELSESQRVYHQKTDTAQQSLDLSTLDIPDFSDLDLQHYPYLSAYTSRGCPFQCSFCSDSIMWGKYRKKKAAQVVRELKQLSQKHYYQLFMLSDLLLNPIITELATEFINSGISIYWDGCLRADEQSCSIKNTQLWRRGGFYRARLGLESGSQQVLQLMKKKVTPAQIRQSLSSLAFAGIQTTTLWIVGHPGETEKDFQDTLNLIEELKDDIYEAECRPFYYYLTGQGDSAEWGKDRKCIPVYPGKTEKLLLFQTWELDGLPSREETYQRVNRFVNHCSHLGIPNIYSLHDTYIADERWKKLHKNAVPSLSEFKKKDSYINECKDFEESYRIHHRIKEEGDFVF